MRIILVLLILLIQHDLHSQAKTKYTSCGLCKERSIESHSPYSIDLKTETPFIIASTVIGIGGYIIRVNDHVNPHTQTELDALDRNDINSFDRGATLNWNPTASHNSDIFLGLSFALNGVFLIDKHTRSNLGPIVLMGLEVTIINSGLTSTVKALVNRTRPYVYNHDLSYEQRTDEESRRSFYSGHASVSASWSFFFAKVFTDYHRDLKTGWKVGVWTVAATVPAVTSYLRVEAGRHFPTDVITGYAMGAFTGWLIPHLHSRSKKNSNINLYPTNVFGYSGLGLQLKLN